MSVDERWFSRLREISMPIAMQVLCLRTLGLSQGVVGQLLGCERTAVLELEHQGLLQCADMRLERSGIDYEFDLEKIGKAALRGLLDASAWVPTSSIYEFVWEPTDKIFSVVTGPDGKLMADHEPLRPQYRLEVEEKFFDWFGEIRKIFLSPQARNELLVLLPLPTNGLLRWAILQDNPPLVGRDGAFRLLAALSALGFGYRDSGHRTKFFSNLVWGSELLFEQVAVAGAPRLNQSPDSELLCRTKGLANDVLVMRPESINGGAQVARAHVFSADFSPVWQNNPNRFDNWSIRDRAQDADDVADSLLWLMTCTSGICVQISLMPRTPEDGQHDVQVLGPKSWIEFLSQGHGAQRSKNKFEPYQGVRDGSGPIRHIDEPPRYADLKKQLRLAKKIRI